MHLFYLDYSGDTGLRLEDPHQPLMVLAALAVPEENWHYVQGALFRTIGMAFYEREQESSEPSGTWEVHATDLFTGAGEFRCWPRTERESLAREMVGILREHRLGLFWGCLDKPRWGRRYPRMSHDFTPPQCLLLGLAPGLQRWLQRQRSRGLLIADEHRAREEEIKLRTAFGASQFYGKFFHPKGGWSPRIIEDVHFARSRDSELLQAADLCAYLVRRFLLGAPGGAEWYKLLRPLVRHSFAIPAPTKEQAARWGLAPGGR